MVDGTIIPIGRMVMAVGNLPCRIGTDYGYAGGSGSGRGQDLVLDVAKR